MRFNALFSQVLSETTLEVYQSIDVTICKLCRTYHLAEARLSSINLNKPGSKENRRLPCDKEYKYDERLLRAIDLYPWSPCGHQSVIMCSDQHNPHSCR